jgi:hypothetical protein
MYVRIALSFLWNTGAVFVVISNYDSTHLCDPISRRVFDPHSWDLNIWVDNCTPFLSGFIVFKTRLIAAKNRRRKSFYFQRETIRSPSSLLFAGIEQD